MGKKRITTIIVPPGTKCPKDFTEGVTTRSGTRCIKTEDVEAPSISMNELETMFGNMGMGMQGVQVEGAFVVEDNEVDQVMKALGAINMGGRRHTKKAGRRHHKKTAKKTAGRRHHKSRK
jgi:hypothetical protein